MEKNPHKVISKIEERYGLHDGDLASRKVTKHLSSARREAILVLRSLDITWSHIGQLLGGREHSTVMRLVTGEKSVDIKGKKRG